MKDSPRYALTVARPLETRCSPTGTYLEPGIGCPRCSRRRVRASSRTRYLERVRDVVSCSRSNRRGSHRRRPRCHWGGQPLSSASLGHARAAPTTSTAGDGHTLARHGALSAFIEGSRGHQLEPAAVVIAARLRPSARSSFRSRSGRGKGRSLRRGHVHNADRQVTGPRTHSTRDNGTSGTPSRTEPMRVVGPATCATTPAVPPQNPGRARASCSRPGAEGGERPPGTARQRWLTDCACSARGWRATARCTRRSCH
jgi:hypothetical protein